MMIDALTDGSNPLHLDLSKGYACPARDIMVKLNLLSGYTYTGIFASPTLCSRS